MKSIYETFSDNEFKLLLDSKGKNTWHNFIMNKIEKQSKIGDKLGNTRRKVE